MTDMDKLAIETELDDKNQWMDWVRYTAKITGKTYCVACAIALAFTLGTIPFTLEVEDNLEVLSCVGMLFGSDPEP